MRGKGSINYPEGTARGITPAHAGKSYCASALCFARGDHPRACGEKSFVGRPARSLWGSPPRMRGKGDFGDIHSFPPGITPAHAGKSHDYLNCVYQRRDHPRACGEKLQASSIILCITGSPPRMRGKGRCVCLKERISRITPAHAGKRRAGTSARPFSWDHPRVCGEKRF